MERLTTMSDKLKQEQDLTYRDQLQKIQFELNLVQRFDPYDPNALDVAADLRGEHEKVLGPLVNAENARSMIDMAGIRFPEFLDDLEDLIELRDFQLAQSKVCGLSSQPWLCSPNGQFEHATNHCINRTSMSERYRNTRTHTHTKSKQQSENTEP